MKAKDFIALANLGRNQRIYVYAVGAFAPDCGTKIGEVRDDAKPDKRLADYLQHEVKGFDFQNEILNVYAQI
jgi:hypothetical protein